jgi:peptidoglycan/LPS O-acetylase OafA/YrhL
MAMGTPTPHQKRLTYLDGWRGVSILVVLGGHFLAGAEGIATTGVELFFVLSGRLMADILFCERFPIGEFFKRRISRILPGAAAFVLITWLAASQSAYAFKPLAVAAALTFTINYAMVITHGVAFVENLWSLCVEEHAYVMLGALAILLRRRGGSALPWLIIAAALSILDAVLSTLVLHQDFRTVYWRTDAHVSSIFLGAVAYLGLRNVKTAAATPVICAIAGVALCFAPDVWRYSFGTAFFAISVATLGQAPETIRRMLGWRPLVHVGLWSYSLYLWQQPFYRLSLDGVLPTPIAVACAVAAGLISFYLIEQPARRWLNARRVTRTAPQPA